MATKVRKDQGKLEIGTDRRVDQPILLAPAERLETKSESEELKKEREFWEINSTIYPTIELSVCHRNLIKTIVRLLEPVAGQKWFDAGCGPAKMATLLWQKSKETLTEIIGLDIVISKRAEERKREIPVLRLVGGSLNKHLPFADDVFDGVISNMVVCYIFDFEGKRGIDAIQEVFNEFARVLKPGGQLIWSVPCNNIQTMIFPIVSSPDIAWNTIKDIRLPFTVIKLVKYVKALKRKGKEGLYTYLSPEEWEEVLEKAGFKSCCWEFVWSHQVWVNKSIRSDK